MSSNWNLEELYKQPPPKFGHGMHKYFGFDPEYLNLNHGSFGSVPLPVQSSANAQSLLLESNPDLFLRFTYQPLLVAVRERLAKLIGAETDECVLVPNASMGLNTILRNIEWEKGDIIIPFSTTYGSIARTAQYKHDIPPHPCLYPFTLTFPISHAAILPLFRAHLRSLPKGGPNAKKVAIIDSIVSTPGVALPWRDLVRICREEGVWSVVDAAHSIGQETGIDLGAVKPDFWVSNCHKWLYAKRACAVLYVPKRNQHIIKSSIPTSHAYISPADRTGPNFVEQYEWNGTIDFVPYLSVAAALDFRAWLGGERVINDYCHNLAIKGGKRLAEVMGTRVMDPSGELTWNMVNVQLPLPLHILPNPAVDDKFRHKLLKEHNAYSGHYHHGGKWWARCSAQVWNEIEDFEKIGQVYLTICAEIIAEYEHESQEDIGPIIDDVKEECSKEVSISPVVGSPLSWVASKFWRHKE